MGDTAEGQDGDPSEPATKPEGGGSGLRIVDIVPDGDLVLDVTFDTSKETLRAAKRAAKPRPGQKQQGITAPVLKAQTRVGYRVQLAVLKQHSKYFDNLLSDTRFAEARSIEARFQQLALRNVKPSDADAGDLPVVEIHEDDEATRSAAQDSVFEDLLRILHRKQSTAPSKAVTMQSLAVLAVLADRFDCTSTVSRYLNALRYKWPATQTRLSRDDGPALSRAAEETLRQKILVAWLLDQPLKMQAATRELIMYGSRQWSHHNQDEDQQQVAAWWDLPDDLEMELHYRRNLILTTIASVQRHFLSLYTSRARQCKLGYDSSPSCDSYQLGEIIKFLAARDLLFLSDFASEPFSTPPPQPHYATVDIGHILASLKQCPNYQIDKNHTNCGLRTRILPILEYIQAMLSAGAVAVAREGWRRDREAVAWSTGVEGEKKKVFEWTRGLATDQRLRYEGALAADRMARALFTAGAWDWTAEDREDGRGVEFGRWKPLGM